MTSQAIEPIKVDPLLDEPGMPPNSAITGVNMIHVPKSDSCPPGWSRPIAPGFQNYCVDDEKY